LTVGVLSRSGPQRVVVVTSAIALITGGAGWLVGSQVRSPADAAAAHRPPPASLVTVAVEKRTLTSKVNTQGTVAYPAPQPVTLNGTVATDDDSAVPLITKAPTASHTLHEGDVLLEVSGRPVIVLTGKVPMYRTLTRGSGGDDVQQLRAALRRLVPNVTVARKGDLDGAALGAVEDLYHRRGYEAARPTDAQRIQLVQLEQSAKSGGQTAVDALNDFRKTYGTRIASGEILFLPQLPVRMTTVTVRAGAPASGVVGTVAAPTLVVNGTVPADDAALLKAGMATELQGPEGETFPATVGALGSAAGPSATVKAGATGTPIRLLPRQPDKLSKYVGQALKVTVTVGGTGGAVLAVPVAAVFTASDGQARVSVQSEGQAVRDVPVEVGLSAGGFVQVAPLDAPALKAGDRVVVGRR